MRARVVVVVLAAVAVARLADAGGTPDAAPAPPVVAVERGEGFESVTTSIDGSIRGLATPRGEDGRRRVLVLVGRPAPGDDGGDDRRHADGDDDDREAWPRPCPGAGPPALLVRAASRPGEDAAVLRDDLPADAAAVEALDLDGDGVDELVLLRPGAAILLGGGGGPDRVLVEHEALGRGPVVDRARRWGGLPRDLLALDGPDGLTLWRARDGGLQPLADVATWRGATLWQDALVTGSVSLVYVGRSDEGLHFVTGARRDGGDRLRLQWIVVADDGAATAEPLRLRLPGPEDLVELATFMMDGAPHVLVATKKKDALGLSAEKRLRLYDLSVQGTRLGVAPVFAVESRMNLWQVGTYRVRDVTGDGRPDLVVGYWKGLTGTRVSLDVYRGVDEGFARSAASTSFDVRDGDRSFLGYGDDVDGDGLADLVLASAARLVVHRGRRSASRLVERRGVPTPVRVDGGDGEIVVSAGSGGTSVQSIAAPAPRVVDLGGDDAILATAPADDDGRAAVAVVRLGDDR